MEYYNLVVCGGTFDHFHKGHKHFLSFIFSISKEVLIGITTDEFVRSKTASNYIEPLYVRRAVLEQFLKKEGFIGRVRISSIDSVFYPKDWESLPIEAIIVTKESVRGAEIINKDRRKKSLKQLKVIVSDIVNSDDGLPISSSAIRSGRIKRDGRSFIKREWLRKPLLLPERLRGFFQRPFGRLLSQVSQATLASFEPSRIVTVGDVATKTFHDFGITQKLSVVDFLVERKKIYQSLEELGFTGDERVFGTINPAAQITPSLFACLKVMFQSLDKHKQLVCKVDGEEDLAVLPVLLLAPLGFYIFYGQPKEKGIVRVDITEEKKEAAYRLAEQFIVHSQS